MSATAAQRRAAAARRLAADLADDAAARPRRVTDRETLRREVLELVATELDTALANHPDGVGIVFRFYPTTHRRGDSAYREWRAAILERAAGACHQCRRQDTTLHAHHTDAWADHPDRRYDPDNGIALCPPCHAAHHGSPGLEQITPP